MERRTGDDEKHDVDARHEVSAPERMASAMRDPREVYDELTSNVRPSPDGWCNVRCPAHDDKRPSLGLKLTEDGKLLVKCHAGCDEIEVRSALDVAEVYSYYDADGTLWGQEIKLPGKRFFVRRPDPNGGWVKDWEGVTRTLYNLPHLPRS